jgi:uncharacterized protein YidB (DUF937 family)
MGLFDKFGGSLKDVLGQVEAAAVPALVSAVLTKTDVGGLQGIVAKLQQGGLNDQVRSWLGNGTNLPISPDQLRSTLGNQQVQQIARQLGLPVDEALKVLSEHLPTAVDQASPNGTLQPVEPAS